MEFWHLKARPVPHEARFRPAQKRCAQNLLMVDSVMDTVPPTRHQAVRRSSLTAFRDRAFEDGTPLIGFNHLQVGAQLTWNVTDNFSIRPTVGYARHLTEPSPALIVGATAAPNSRSNARPQSLILRASRSSGGFAFSSPQLFVLHQAQFNAQAAEQVNC
jgi:hypothetical protein